MLRRLSLTVTACKQVFFTDEKMFYINPPVSTENDRVWSAGRKRDCLFKSAVFWSRESSLHRELWPLRVHVCLQGKGRLHFVQEKSKFNADYYVNELLPKLMDNCHHFAWPTFHISARWSTCACSKIDRIVAGSLPSLSRLHRQGRMASKQPGFESTWLPRLGLEEYPGAEDSASDDMGWAAARSYQKVIVSFRKRLRACVNAEGGRFEYKL